MPNILYVMIKQGGFNRIRHLMKTTVIGVFNTITKPWKSLYVFQELVCTLNIVPVVESHTI